MKRLRSMIVGAMIVAQVVLTAVPVFAHPPRPNCRTYYIDQIRPPRNWNGIYSRLHAPATCRGIR